MFTKIFALLTSSFVVTDGSQKLIIGGDVTEIEKHPYSAFLGVSCSFKGNRSGWICGSSIVHKSVLLTAAHCLHPCELTSDIIVAVGETHRFKAYKYRALRFVHHEKFDPTTFEADIGLVQLDNWFVMGSKVQPVTLATTTRYNVEAWVAGWGKIKKKPKSGIGSRSLKSLKQTVFPRTKCLDIFEKMPDGSICAGNSEEGGSAVQGDSGSALVVIGGKKPFIQIGLVSYYVPNLSKTIVIYTEIAYHYQWIKEKKWFTPNNDRKKPKDKPKDDKKKPDNKNNEDKKTDDKSSEDDKTEPNDDNNSDDKGPNDKDTNDKRPNDKSPEDKTETSDNDSYDKTEPTDTDLDNRPNDKNEPKDKNSEESNRNKNSTSDSKKYTLICHMMHNC